MRPSRAVTVLVFLSLATCGRDPLDPGDDAVESILVSPPATTVAIGSSVGLSAHVLGLAGTALTDRPVHWASEDPDVATVSAAGVVTAHQIGVVQVAASTGGRSGIAMVTVTDVPVASVHVSPGNKALFVGETFQVTAEPRDARGNVLPGRTVSWSSNNEQVASVSASGLVTALSPGGAIVTASAEGHSAPVSVTVSAIPVASVQVDPASQSLVEGQTAQLAAHPLDANGNPLVGRVILWSTSDASVATVTSTGVITAQGRGTATITATCEGKTGSAVVTVNARPVNAVVVTPAQSLIERGKNAQLSAQVLDDLGRVVPGAPITWSSSDDAVAMVSSSGLVTAVAEGKAEISASSAGKTGAAQITVTPIPVANVVVSPSAPVIAVGRTVQLTAEAFSATGQLLTGRTVTWSSSTPSVARVDANGLVTGVSGGSTVVFASIDGVLGWATVTVAAAPSPGPATPATVTVSPDAATLGLSDTVKLTAVVRDQSGVVVNAAVTWSSSNTAVAQVASDGTVTSGLLPGSAVITAQAGAASGTATITVRLGG